MTFNESTSAIPFKVINLFFFMMMIVLRYCKNNKIFNSVIILFPIYMMDMIAFFKLYTKMFFHYLSMFSNPSIAIPNLNISTWLVSFRSKFSSMNTTFPNRRIRSFLVTYSFSRARLRAILTSSEIWFKRFFTITTVNITQFFRYTRTLITTIFSCLSVPGKIFFTLRTNKSIHNFILYYN